MQLRRRSWSCSPIKRREDPLRSYRDHLRRLAQEACQEEKGEEARPLNRQPS